jgi:mRNA interferase MazF
MEKLVKGDIVVIDFPFSSLKESKRRPALIVKIPSGEDLILCQITSESQEKSVEITLNDKDFYAGKLKRDSYIRIDKIASIEKSLVRYKIGALKEEKFNKILKKIISFLKE